MLFILDIGDSFSFPSYISWYFSLPYHIRVVVLAGELTDVLEVVEEKDGDTEEEGGEDYQDDQEAAIKRAGHGRLSL